MTTSLSSGRRRRLAQLALGANGPPSLSARTSSFLRRAVRIWFTPRIELLPLPAMSSPSRAMHQSDPVDQRVTICFSFSMIFTWHCLVVAGSLAPLSRGSRRPLLLLPLSAHSHGLPHTLETPRHALRPGLLSRSNRPRRPALFSPYHSAT